MRRPRTTTPKDAHRGVMAAEPENTLRSFLRAEREGLDGIELDL
ncbi:glycerophosphodiester phosphodiesterase family protein, partial [Streptomyces sp. NPDC004232]